MGVLSSMRKITCVVSISSYNWKCEYISRILELEQFQYVIINCIITSYLSVDPLSMFQKVVIISVEFGRQGNYRKNINVSQYTDRLARYRDTRYKYETVFSPSSLYNGKHYICKTVSSYWDASQTVYGLCNINTFLMKSYWNWPRSISIWSNHWVARIEWFN